LTTSRSLGRHTPISSVTRNTGERPGPLDKITMWVFCSGAGSQFWDWGSYSFVRLENSVSTWVLGAPLHSASLDFVYTVPVHYPLLRNFQRPADHRTLPRIVPKWPVRPGPGPSEFWGTIWHFCLLWRPPESWGPKQVLRLHIYIYIHVHTSTYRSLYRLHIHAHTHTRIYTYRHTYIDLHI